MKSKIFIENLEIYTLQSPEDKRPHWVSHFRVPSANELLIKIKTNEGHEGFGMATSYTDISPIITPFKNGIAEEIIGEVSIIKLVRSLDLGFILTCLRFAVLPIVIPVIPSVKLLTSELPET